MNFSFFSSSLFFISIFFFVLVSNNNKASAGLEPVPYEHFCRHRHGLSFGDMRRVMLYAHNLLQFKSGEKFAAAIQKCKHHVDEDEVRCGDDANTRAAVAELLKDPKVEAERRKLHHRSKPGFKCVHDFETLVALDHPDQEWHAVVPEADEEVEPEVNVDHDDGDFDEKRKKHVSMFAGLHGRGEPLHPDSYH
jgi:hypothetical protein